MARPVQRRGSKRRAKQTGMTVDFTGVEAEGRSISDGWAHGVIKSAEVKESRDTGNPMFEMKWQATRGKEKATVYDYLVNTEAALWKFKLALEALGLDVPDGAMDLEADELIDLEADILIGNDDSYDGTARPKVLDYRAAGAGDIDDANNDDAEQEESQEEEERPRKKKKISRRDRDEDAEEEPEDEDVEEEEERPRRVKKRSKTRDEDEEEPEEEEVEEEEEAPRASRKKPAKPKIRVGSKVEFEDDKGRAVRGVVTAIDGKEYIVKTTKGDEYGVEESDLELV